MVNVFSAEQIAPPIELELPNLELGDSGYRQPPTAGQLLKWIGNKHKSAGEIASCLPMTYARYFEPFLGGGAVLATMAPTRGVAGDLLGPLVDLWLLVKSDPDRVIEHYGRWWHRYIDNRQSVYDEALASYNADPNALDLLFVCRTCYGGVVRFTKKGTMSTPLGPHRAMPPSSFERRVRQWRECIQGTEFRHTSFEETMAEARAGDVVYCDPPYAFAQQILYGAQSFELVHLWQAIAEAARRGAKVALSIDGFKASGDHQLELNVPEGLFTREVFIAKGGSMLKRMQHNVVSEKWRVSDRLLLTW